MANRRHRSFVFRALFSIGLALLLSSSAPVHAQGTLTINITGNGATSLRLAVANFKPVSADPQSAALKRAFDSTLFNDLKNAGIFDVVSKSMLPQATPGSQQEINLAQWASAPASAQMVVFGAFATSGGRAIISGYLDDAKNAQYPSVLGENYNEDASESSVRDVAHRFADEIILRLGGGVPGIAETKIYFVKRSGDLKAPTKEIWVMDYDGANAHAITHLGTVSMSPRVSPDNTRVAFASLTKYGWQIRMWSLVLGRTVTFATAEGTNQSPAWSPNGNQIALSSSRSGDPEIWVTDSNGNAARRLTSFRGPDSSPVWNPKTGGQIAWVSTPHVFPEIYMMDADGANVQQLTSEGYATSPSWSPDGKFLAFAWNRKYGPGAPGGQDIYVMDVATHLWTQLTHNIGPCDFPTWSPDGRHIAFANSPDGKETHKRIMTMLADGTQQQALPGASGDMPNWSWK